MNIKILLLLTTLIVAIPPASYAQSVPGRLKDKADEVFSAPPSHTIREMREQQQHIIHREQQVFQEQQQRLNREADIRHAEAKHAEKHRMEQQRQIKLQEDFDKAAKDRFIRDQEYQEKIQRDKRVQDSIERTKHEAEEKRRITENIQAENRRQEEFILKKKLDDEARIKDEVAARIKIAENTRQPVSIQKNPENLLAKIDQIKRGVDDLPPQPKDKVLGAAKHAEDQAAALKAKEKLQVAKGTKGLKEQVADLVPLNNGKHRVTLRSEKQQLEIDLAGKDHAGIPTPHTKVSPRNTQAPGHLQPAYNTSTKSSTTRASTQEEIRATRKYLERQKR